MIGYTFSDGPFRDLVIKFGYDPRTDPEARLYVPPFLSFSLSSERVQILMRKFRSFSYQHFILRNINNVRSKALPGTKGASQALAAKGKHLRSGTSTGGGENGEGGGEKGSK